MIMARMGGAFGTTNGWAGRGVVLGLVAIAAAGCGPRDHTAAAGAPGHAAERAYRDPPQIVSAERLAGGGVLLSGTARAGTRVRLASPSGAALQASPDASGAWRLTLPPSPDLRLFGLSMMEAARPLQAEGYLAVTPAGQAAQIRSGAGAMVLAGGGEAPRAPRILAVDFDRAGAGRPVAVVVSGVGVAGRTVILSSDGAPRGRALVGADGRFSLVLDAPLSAGRHRFEAVEDAARDTAEVDLSAAAPLAGAPFRATPLAGGWRIDWLTPGGGEQSTVVL